MKKKVFAFLLVAILTFSSLAGCGKNPDSGSSGDGDSAVKDTLVVAIPESPSYMDPQVQASIATFRGAGTWWTRELPSSISGRA